MPAMIRIPFTKSHGDRNDFLLTWTSEAPATRLPEIARALCDRHGGVGADGWILVARSTVTDQDADIRLLNSDGSAAEISGNGTRCAAAFLIQNGLNSDTIRIRTGAGVKQLRRLERSGLRFLFEMNMGRPEVTHERFTLPTSAGTLDVTIAWVGNPQCAIPVDDFDFDWKKIGAEIESHAQFPARTNVSFFRAVDEHTIEARFYERGAGETMSSGTGATGTAAAAIVRGLARSPVSVLTSAGVLQLRWDTDIFLTGPAEIVASGEFYLNG